MCFEVQTMVDENVERCEKRKTHNDPDAAIDDVTCTRRRVKWKHIAIQPYAHIQRNQFILFDTKGKERRNGEKTKRKFHRKIEMQRRWKFRAIADRRTANSLTLTHKYEHPIIVWAMVAHTDKSNEQQQQHEWKQNNCDSAVYSGCLWMFDFSVVVCVSTQMKRTKRFQKISIFVPHFDARRIFAVFFYFFHFFFFFVCFFFYVHRISIRFLFCYTRDATRARALSVLKNQCSCVILCAVCRSSFFLVFVSFFILLQLKMLFVDIREWMMVARMMNAQFFTFFFIFLFFPLFLSASQSIFKWWILS